MPSNIFQSWFLKKLINLLNNISGFNDHFSTDLDYLVSDSSSDLKWSDEIVLIIL
jgi:hypothetical protein